MAYSKRIGMGSGDVDNLGDKGCQRELLLRIGLRGRCEIFLSQYLLLHNV